MFDSEPVVEQPLAAKEGPLPQTTGTFELESSSDEGIRVISFFFSRFTDLCYVD